METAESTVVPVWGNHDKKVNQCAWPSMSIKNKIKRQIMFRNSTKKGTISEY